MPASGIPSPVRIALFAATAWEVSAVRDALPSMRLRRIEGHRVYVGSTGGREYWLMRTGIGDRKASESAAWLLHYGRFDLAVSTGFVCALVPAEIGALLVGSEVVSMQPVASGLVQVPGSEREAFLAYVGEREPAARYGTFLSVDRIIGEASEKHRYARATAAMGLDMESGALAREARHHAVPFVIARTVSDLLDEDLPLDFNLFLTPTRWLQGALVFLTHARRSVHGMMRLRRQSLQAAARLTGFFRAYMAAAGQPRIYPGTTRESA